MNVKCKLIRSKAVLFVFCFLLVVPCFAENEFYLQVTPVVEAPLGLKQFSPGMGAGVSLDWAFFPFLKDFTLGVFAGGEFFSLPVQTGDPLTFVEGKAGPFVRYHPFDRWSFCTGLSGGFYQYSRGDDSGTQGLMTFTLGVQFHLSPHFSLFTDGAYTYRAFSSSESLSTFGASLGLRLNLSEIMGGRARIKVDKTEQYRVFPVSWAWYENNPVATVKITNEEPNAITDVNLSFYMDSYMGQGWVFASVPRLIQGESVDVPVTALFNEAMLSLTETVTANGEIQVQYRSLGTRKDTVIPIQMPIFHRNTLSWDDDRRAAAFVSPRDSSARLFARYVASAVEGQTQTGDVPKNVRNAAAMFEALRLYGMSYVVVPATSYKSVSADESVLDNVSYPYQALHYRSGDCSYLAILFCSLLEALDIETAFITIPGHIYAAFEVGSNDWQAGSSDIIEIDGRRWLPVEITVPDEGFTRAWRIGGRQWRTGGAEAQLYPIRECWEIYPSVTVPASGDHSPEMPLRPDIIRAMEAEIRNLGR
ncbi:MAG: transglutaminase-like domain-containing protein [Treponema sp.]|nr:transglutaminase-like domain-containing protein [Treponema sp.]